MSRTHPPLMPFREELLDEMVSAAFANGAESVRTICAATLDAALAFRQTVECPECGLDEHGYPMLLEGSDCPNPRCIDGRVPGETRLAIVEPVGVERLLTREAVYGVAYDRDGLGHPIEEL